MVSPGAMTLYIFLRNLSLNIFYFFSKNWKAGAIGHLRGSLLPNPTTRKACYRVDGEHGEK